LLANHTQFINYIKNGVPKKYKTQFKIFNNIIQNHIIIEVFESRKIFIDLIIIYLSIQGKELENLTLFGIYLLELIQYILNLSLKFKIVIKEKFLSSLTTNKDIKDLIYLPSGREFYYRGPYGIILEFLTTSPRPDEELLSFVPFSRDYPFSNGKYIHGNRVSHKIHDLGWMFGSSKDKEYTKKTKEGKIFLKKFIVDKDYTLWIKFNEVYQPFNFNDGFGQQEKITEENIAYVAYVEQ
jgi:hypothetical protein